MNPIKIRIRSAGGWEVVIEVGARHGSPGAIQRRLTELGLSARARGSVITVEVA